MGGAWKDLEIAARSLARRPTFALGAALTLGLGIGATTTIYSVVYGVMMRPLPFEAYRLRRRFQRCHRWKSGSQARSSPRRRLRCEPESLMGGCTRNGRCRIGAEPVPVGTPP